MKYNLLCDISAEHFFRNINSYKLQNSLEAHISKIKKVSLAQFFTNIIKVIFLFSQDALIKEMRNLKQAPS